MDAPTCMETQPKQTLVESETTFQPEAQLQLEALNSWTVLAVLLAALIAEFTSVSHINPVYELSEQFWFGLDATCNIRLVVSDRSALCLLAIPDKVSA